MTPLTELRDVPIVRFILNVSDAPVHEKRPRRRRLRRDLQTVPFPCTGEATLSSVSFGTTGVGLD
jgi:hypothetical protein